MVLSKINQNILKAGIEVRRKKFHKRLVSFTKKIINLIVDGNPLEVHLDFSNSGQMVAFHSSNYNSHSKNGDIIRLHYYEWETIDVFNGAEALEKYYTKRIAWAWGMLNMHLLLDYC